MLISRHVVSASVWAGVVVGGIVMLRSTETSSPDDELHAATPRAAPTESQTNRFHVTM